jgi:hypothetical protein
MRTDSLEEPSLTRRRSQQFVSVERYVPLSSCSLLPKYLYLSLSLLSLSLSLYSLPHSLSSSLPSPLSLSHSLSSSLARYAAAAAVTAAARLLLLLRRIVNFATTRAASCQNLKTQSPEFKCFKWFRVECTVEREERRQWGCAWCHHRGSNPARGRRARKRSLGEHRCLVSQIRKLCSTASSVWP